MGSTHCRSLIVDRRGSGLNDGARLTGPKRETARNTGLKRDVSAALARGMPSVEVAGFLARGEDEVQDKAKELGAHIPPQILGPGG
jgi:hypothetical protein